MLCDRCGSAAIEGGVCTSCGAALPAAGWTPPPPAPPTAQPSEAPSGRSQPPTAATGWAPPTGPPGSGAPGYTPYGYGGPALRYAPKQWTGKSIAGIVCGLVALVFCPILLGPIGIGLGASARSAGDEKGRIAIAVGIVGLIGGIAIGVVLYSNRLDSV
jgi:hypothetical protein